MGVMAGPDDQIKSMPSLPEAPQKRYLLPVCSVVVRSGLPGASRGLVDLQMPYASHSACL